MLKNSNKTTTLETPSHVLTALNDRREANTDYHVGVLYVFRHKRLINAISYIYLAA